MSLADRHPQDDSPQPLDWLASILWPRRNTASFRAVDRRSGSAPAGGDPVVGRSWWAAPSRETAEILIPADSSAAARAAVRRHHDGSTPVQRVRSVAAELVMVFPGLADRVLSRRLVTVDSPEGPHQFVDGSTPEGLLNGLAEIVSAHHPGLRKLHVAVSLSRSKSNRKPVLQLIDQDGTVFGWAKVGWNRWTADLVTNEARWLSRPGPLQVPPSAVSPTRSMVRPGLVDLVDIEGFTVIVTTGFRPRRRPSLTPALDLAVIRAVAELGTLDRLPLTDTPWWATVERVLPLASDDERRVVERVIDEAGDRPFEVGAWHGDLAPWNTMSIPVEGGDGRRPARGVIDWEFAADGVPVGFDLCHHHTQVGVELKNLTPAEALDRSARLSPAGLIALGVQPDNHIAVFNAYLVELIRRTLALRAAGMPVDGVGFGSAAVNRRSHPCRLVLSPV